MAKKKGRKRRRTAPPSVDTNEKRRERLEAKREARERVAAAQRKVERRERLIRYALIAAFVVAAAWFFFFRGQTPSAIAGHPIEKFSEAGTNQHVTTPVAYEETPPVAGQHAPGAAGCGVYNEQIPDESYVHSLEHGTVALLYDPTRVEPSEIETLEGIARDFGDRVISAPYEGAGRPIYVTSWGERMPLDSVDSAAIREYIETFRGHGPEDLPCSPDSDQSFEPSPSATPSPTPSKSKDK